MTFRALLGNVHGIVFLTENNRSNEIKEKEYKTIQHIPLIKFKIE